MVGDYMQALFAVDLLRVAWSLIVRIFPELCMDCPCY